MSSINARLVFTFPGQGSFNSQLLRNLYFSQKALRKLFYAVDDAASEVLGIPFLPVVFAEGTSQGQLDQYPDLDQLGIYLADYATAQLWLQRKVVPDLLLGHSFGELAAFAVAGIYSFEEGARIVCQRVLSLRETARAGKMASVGAPRAQVEAALSEFARGSSISVLNHPEQTVVAGPEEELTELRDRFAHRAVSVTFLKSRYAFHSPLLSLTSQAFGIALRGYHFEKPSIPVFVGTEQRLVDSQMDLAAALARQLVTPLDFGTSVRRLFSDGYRRYLECGAGTIVTKIVGSILKSEREHRAWATFPMATDTITRLKEVESELGAVELAVHCDQPGVLSVASGSAPSASPISCEPTPFEPIAIVGMGCVLPGGADNPDTFWNNITTGVSGIVDLTEIDPHARVDFVAGKVNGTTQEIISDKTYTLLNGSITGIRYDGALLGGQFSEQEFEHLTKGQKILALSMAQARLPRGNESKSSRLQCILGSTADGSAELDESHFSASVREVLKDVDDKFPGKKAFSQMLENALPGWRRNPEDLEPHKLCAAVAHTVLGVSPDCTYLIDSACSSSLYSLALGARALRCGEADIVYAGGVFAPGPANNNLFAQFRGLTPNGIRPFDKKADGVVFGDGAGVLALKRLSDAIDDGDSIFGVIRSEGFSSDGKSPSINVPQSEGQVMALRMAYDRAELDPKSVQYVEAHATATPVGDAVEFKALREILPRQNGSYRLLGSVKALIGHTGWTSGVASVIKICKALQHRQIPKQFNYEAPNPSIEIQESGFAISADIVDWPENKDGLPRRAGVNGFGFGGTNAHLVVEEYNAPYHRVLADRFRGKRAEREEVVLVAAERLVPDGGRGFDRSGLRMPKKRMVLPDVAEHMDASQYLATMAAEKIADSLSANRLQPGLRIGVALGLESKTERGIRANERIFLDRLGRIVGAIGGSEELLKHIRSQIMQKVIPSGPYTLPGLMPNVAASRITHTFNWHGPNIVVDRSEGSLVQALDAGIKFVRAGDCEVALAGGVNAWIGHDGSAREAVALLAFATAETAQKNKLPILARLQLGDQTSAAVQIRLDEGDKSYRGAMGSVELLDAVREVSSKSTAATLIWNGAPFMTLLPLTEKQPPSQAKKGSAIQTKPSHAYVQGTPIRNYTQVLVDSAPLESHGSVKGRSYLFLTDQREAWRDFEQEKSLRDLNYAIATPIGVGIPGAHEIDVSSEETLRKGIDGLRSLNFDTIIGVKQLSYFKDEDLLLTDFTETRRLLDLLFGICRQRYDDISQQRCSVATACLGISSTGELDSFTGLFGGFMKSLSREQPEAICKAVATDETRLMDALNKVATELEAKERIVEVIYRYGRRCRTVLTESLHLHRAGKPWVSKDSVVLATGGGRGVTAVLAEYLLQTYGCTVIALGRTDPGLLPEYPRGLDEAAFEAYESQFYREQLAKDPSKKIPELKKLYERYQASHELLSVIRRCETLPGKYSYIQCDINDPASIDHVVEKVLTLHGRIDAIIHGAGVQVSKALPRKALADFQGVVNTKMASLGHLYHACHQRGIHKSVHFHILTSAFSYLGNDGQPDYGAANESMNRLAARLNLRYPGCYWSSLAWLGWAGIGMTRGTEYAALAASRRLRGITREEGQQMFGDAMSGPPASPINILLADGEVAFYHPEIRKDVVLPAVASEKNSESVVEWAVSPETMPFLTDHIVRGIPTVPGSFIIAMAADAAHKLLPDLKIVQFERTRFLRLVRAYPGVPARVRAVSKLAERDGDETVVQVQILMDFIHKSGHLLGKDLLHTEIYVRMAPMVPKPAEVFGGENGLAGNQLPDPYVMEGSPVRLNGAFRTMKHIVVGQRTRRAEYKLNGQSRYGSDFDYLIPNVILVDAFWRFGTVRENENGSLSVYVPERCDAMKVFFDYLDFGAGFLQSTMTFDGANPRAEGDMLYVGPIDVRDASGRVLLRVEGGVCRKFGEVEKRRLASAV
jgi:acyl transferase domain-containing protein/NAD(P)-dependent dehydrogenase (short-subunit alcohol dehydrogenase family)